jgi:hypothetical protein
MCKFTLPGLFLCGQLVHAIWIFMQLNMMHNFGKIREVDKILVYGQGFFKGNRHTSIFNVMFNLY